MTDLDAPDEPGDLYEARGDVSLASPIMQGDVFDHVSVPGLSEHPLTVAVVMQFRPPGAVVEGYRAAWR